MRATDLGSTLEALPYWVLSPAPEGTKNAPFTKMSPSVRQFHPAHSVSAASKRLVTYNITNMSNQNLSIAVAVTVKKSGKEFQGWFWFFFFFSFLKFRSLQVRPKSSIRKDKLEMGPLRNGNLLAARQRHAPPKQVG